MSPISSGPGFLLDSALSDPLSSRLEHRFLEAVDFIEGRVDVGRHTDSLELLVGDAHGEDSLLVEEPSAQVSRSDAFDLDGRQAT